MEKGNQYTPDLDVTDEKYAGPSAHIAALGTGVIKHLKWALIGIAGGGLFAYVFHKPAGSFIEHARKIAEGLKQEIPEDANLFAKVWNEVKYTLGSVIHFAFGDEDMAMVLRNATVKNDFVKPRNIKKTELWFDDAAMSKQQGFGNWFFSHIPIVGKFIRKSLREATEIPTKLTIRGEGALSEMIVGEGETKAVTIKDPRFTNALTFGGAFGMGGYITGWLAALITGAQHGNRGKHQFQRAKTQIKSLQEDNADLEKINDDLHAKYVKAATRLNIIQSEQETMARELAERSELPATKELPDATPAQAPTAPTEVQLSHTEHEGKLAEKELAVA